MAVEMITPEKKGKQLRRRTPVFSYPFLSFKFCIAIYLAVYLDPKRNASDKVGRARMKPTGWGYNGGPFLC